MLGKMTYLQLCLVFLGVLCTVVLLIYAAAAIEFKLGKGPRLSVRATLKSKRTALGSAEEKNGDPRYYTLFFGTFLFGNTDAVELELQKEQYEAMSAGSTGILVFRGGRCISFEKN